MSHSLSAEQLTKLLRKQSEAMEFRVCDMLGDQAVGSWVEQEEEVLQTFWESLKEENPSIYENSMFVQKANSSKMILPLGYMLRHSVALVLEEHINGSKRLSFVCKGIVDVCIYKSDKKGELQIKCTQYQRARSSEIKDCIVWMIKRLSEPNTKIFDLFAQKYID